MEVKQKVRNGEIDILRFIFAICIFIYHFAYISGYYPSICRMGWISVEFFFLVSGYFMASTAKKYLSTPTGETIASKTWTFILSKIKIFYPYYLFSLIIKFIFIAVTSPYKKTFSVLIKSLPSIFILYYPLNWNDKGLYFTGAWYLSAMIISMIILFPLLLRKYDVMSKIIFPIVSLFILGFIMHEYKKLNTHGEWNVFTYTGLLRSTAELMLGVFLKEIVDKINELKERKASILLTIVKYFIYSCILICVVKFDFRKFDIYLLLFMAVAIVLSMSQLTYSIKQTRFSDYLGKFSLIVYIFHGCLYDIVTNFLPKKTQLPLNKFILLCTATLALCFLLYYFTNFIIFIMNKVHNKKAIKKCCDSIE